MTKTKLVAYIKLLRPQQWIKNGFVFAPLIFSGKFLQLPAIFHTLLAAVFFSIAASSVYILNDINDVEKDRQHPVKRQRRPLAAGTISLTSAKITLLICYVLMVMSYLLDPRVMLIVFIYVLLNYFYTVQFKRIPIVDIFIISIGFVLRIIAGAIIINTPLSPWMLITTFSLALYLATIKRQQELVEVGVKSRGVLALYNERVLHQYAMMSAVCTIIFYSLFVLVSNTDLMLTIPVVLFGIFRYWLIVEMCGEGESPTDVLYRDVPLIITIILWVLICLYALWP